MIHSDSRERNFYGNHSGTRLFKGSLNLLDREISDRRDYLRPSGDIVREVLGRTVHQQEFIEIRFSRQDSEGMQETFCSIYDPRNLPNPY
jgi:hypothetical protein